MNRDTLEIRMMVGDELKKANQDAGREVWTRIGKKREKKKKTKFRYTEQPDYHAGMVRQMKKIIAGAITKDQKKYIITPRPFSKHEIADAAEAVAKRCQFKLTMLNTTPPIEEVEEMIREELKKRALTPA